jgi:hypothetical protein
MLLFITFYSYYVYQALLAPEPQIGSMLLSASDTNLFVSIMSQIFSETMADLAVRALDTVRWGLAAGASGISLPAFFGLSSNTQWTMALFLALNDSLGIIWGALRYERFRPVADMS